MRSWQSDRGLRRLVDEHRAGGLNRRQFLARLGGAAAGATALSLAGGARPAGAQKKVTVTMWDTEPNPATRAAVKVIVEDFHKLHKDIEVRAEGMGWSDMDRKLQAAMAAKSPPTASHTQTYVVTSFRAKGLIEPVDDIVKAIGEDKIFPSVLQWLKYPDGKYWGITHAWGAEILGGRGDYAAAAGVDPQNGRPGTTGFATCRSSTRRPSTTVCRWRGSRSS
jgi:multiple sugar transport system substrate-binding protein